MNKPNPPPWLAAFQARTDLLKYGDNALGLFALGVRFNLDDLDTIAADAITDGADDKKCDLIFLDTDNGYAVVAQCYQASKPKAEAPANKASDLNTAVNWLLQRDLTDLPERIRSSAEDLRKAINDGTITKFHLWYVHNLPESKNVFSELKTVEATASAALSLHYKERSVSVSALEVGSDTLTEWYNDTQSPILVTDKFTIDLKDGFEESGPNWRAFVTAIPLQFLRREYKKHNVKLFSANVRDYLGSISSDSNINNGIKKTAEGEPENFWAYNNGLTILVNSYIRPRRRASGRLRFTFNGMSIVNGAQTTGAIASLEKAPPKSANVAVRFIQTEIEEIVYDIIRYNNSQNKVTASDFRSTDSIQRRIKEDMAKIPSAEYEGGRRGGPTDAIRRRPHLLASYTVGQALAALHGDATVAYNQRADIWSSDTLYSKYFNDHTTAAHIVFAYSLLRAVEDHKISLVKKSKSTPVELTTSEEEQLKFFDAEELYFYSYQPSHHAWKFSAQRRFLTYIEYRSV
jgi:AIPR protein